MRRCRSAVQAVFSNPRKSAQSRPSRRQAVPGITWLNSAVFRGALNLNDTWCLNSFLLIITAPLQAVQLLQARVRDLDGFDAQRDFFLELQSTIS